MRTLTFPVRSLGSLLPTDIDVPALSAWISERRGKETDLITWHIETTLKDQLPTVESPAAGGDFYAGRILDACGNVDEGRVTLEFDPNPREILSDVTLAQTIRKKCWWSLPSPSALNITDAYFGDVEEYTSALSETVSSLCRSMRDAGIPGHILTTEHPGEIELEYLSGKRYLWVVAGSSLSTILEIQKDIVLKKGEVSLLPDLLNSYEIRNVYLQDADEASVHAVLQHLDPEYIYLCGVGPEEGRTEYWKKLAALTVKTAE